jgi:sugar lactone lactonase YvrE
LRLAKDVIDGKVRLTESEIRELTSTFTNLYNSKPNVVKTPADDTIYVGDLHGLTTQLFSLGIMQIEGLSRLKHST